MPFPRAVILEACTFLGSKLRFHGEFEDLALRWELDQLADQDGVAIHHRCRNLFRYLRDSPEATFEGHRLDSMLIQSRSDLVN
jgi:hypothetical protein